MSLGLNSRARREGAGVRRPNRHYQVPLDTGDGRAAQPQSVLGTADIDSCTGSYRLLRCPLEPGTGRHDQSDLAPAILVEGIRSLSPPYEKGNLHYGSQPGL